MNRNLFPTATPAGNAPVTNTTNAAGGVAYDLGPKHSLAQIACTGCLNDTFYASASTQLDTVLGLAQKVDSQFLADLALYSRDQGYMKDMPALLLAVLAARVDPEARQLLRTTFPLVINNTKMIRNFVTIMNSGKVGRKAFGTVIKGLIQDAITRRSPDRLFADSIGDKPGLGDIIKAVHPKPNSPEMDGLFAYLIGKDTSTKVLPSLVRDYEVFKALAATGNVPKGTQVPKVPFQMLSSLSIPDHVWIDIAKNGGWHMVRMNLNTFHRHGVFKDPEAVKSVAAKLRDPVEIQKARVFPYQILTAWLFATDLPHEIKEALQDAMELATKNVPALDGNVVVAVDTSGSMSSEAVTGTRPGATSKIMAIDVASLVASSILRTTKQTKVIPFDTMIHDASTLNPRDSVMTNTQKLRKFGGGGTDCASVLRHLNETKAKVDVVIYVSDNESWVNVSRFGYNQGTTMMQEWKVLKKRNPKAKLVCIDTCPNGTVQATNSTDILNVGGFSDNVFLVVSDFVLGRSKDQWVDVITKHGEVRRAQRAVTVEAALEVADPVTNEGGDEG